MGRTIVFLLGSGASLGANMPSVRTLTERILSGDGVIRHTDGCYYIFRPRNYSEAHEAVERNVAFLGELKTIANHYFAVHWPGRQADYEDLADLCHEIDDAIGGGG